MRQIEQDKLRLILELKNSPVVLIACKKLSIPTSTFYRWKNSDKRFAKEANRAIAKGKETISDVAESYLIKWVKKGDQKSVFHWLKTFRHPYKKSDRTVIEINNKKEIVKKVKERRDVLVPTIPTDDSVNISPKLEKQFQQFFKVWFKRNDREKALVKLLIDQGVNSKEINDIMTNLPT